MVMTCNAFYMFVLDTVIVLVMATLTSCQDNLTSVRKQVCFLSILDANQLLSCLWWVFVFVFYVSCWVLFQQPAWRHSLPSENQTMISYRGSDVNWEDIYPIDPKTGKR